MELCLSSETLTPDSKNKKNIQENGELESLDSRGRIIDANARANSRNSRKNTILSKVWFYFKFFTIE